MEIKLRLDDDQSGFNSLDLDSALYIVEVNGKEIGEIVTYKQFHKTILPILLDMEEKNLIVSNTKDNA